MVIPTGLPLGSDDKIAGFSSVKCRIPFDDLSSNLLSISFTKDGQQMMRLNRLAVTSVCAAIGICASPIWAGTQTTVLYQGSGTQTPQSQGWLFSFAPGA